MYSVVLFCKQNLLRKERRRKDKTAGKEEEGEQHMKTGDEEGEKHTKTGDEEQGRAQKVMGGGETTQKHNNWEA